MLSNYHKHDNLLKEECLMEENRGSFIYSFQNSNKCFKMNKLSDNNIQISFI